MPTKATPKKEKTVKAPKTGVTIPVVTVDGKEKEPMAVPESLFGAPYNKKLVALAVRVYRANQREGSASTKTRGEVEGSTRKIYRQKGTGRARHGGIRAPIFVGGGIAFGPRPRDYRMNMPKAMRQQALSSALSFVVKNGRAKIVEGVETLDVKTKLFAVMFRVLGYTKRTLYIVGNESQKTMRAVRNMEKVTVRLYTHVTTYDLVTHEQVLFAKDAIEGYMKAAK